MTRFKLAVAIFCISQCGCVKTQTSAEVANKILSTCKLAKPVKIDPKTLMGEGYRFTRVVFDHRPDLAGYQNELPLDDQGVSLTLFNIKNHGAPSGVLGGRVQGSKDDTEIGFEEDDEGNFDFEDSAEPIPGGVHYVTTYDSNGSDQKVIFEMILQNDAIVSLSFTYPSQSGPDQVCLKSFSL